jgi:hypothetical protein
MFNNDEELPSFDASKYAGVLDDEKLTSIWSKIEVAKIMIQRGNDLVRQAYVDLDFYEMTHRMKKDSNG